MAGVVERLTDGFKTTIDFGVTSFWEIEVKPPGLDGGEPIPTTTMRNTAWTSKSPRALKSMTPGSCRVAYDPTIFDDVLTLINVNKLITVTFPDGATYAFWGYLRNFEPDGLSIGNMPTANVTIEPTCSNTSGVEVAPDLTEGTGT